MCGILFLTTENSRASKAVRRRYQQQKGRGQQGFGYLTIRDNKIEHLERATTEGPILDKLRNETASSILFHHRTPTSTPNYIETTHPFFISDPRFTYDYYIIHNGVIHNWEKMYEDFKKDGYTFLTEMRECSSIRFPHIENTKYDFGEKIKINDSEALSLELACFFEGRKEKIGARGTIAFIALQVEKDGTVKSLIWGHNGGNPLKIEEDNTVFCLRSEGKSGVNVPEDIIYYMDWNTGEVIEQQVEIGAYYARKTGFTVNGVGSWEKTDTDTYERVLDPTHPLLPAPYDGSLKDMGAAMARAKAAEDADEILGGHDDRGYFGRGGRDDERDQTIINWGPDDDNETIDNDAIVREMEIDRIMGELAGEDDNIIMLRRDLRTAMDHVRDADTELQDAKELLRQAIVADKSLDELECARSLVQIATEDRLAYIRECNSVSAELSAHLEDFQSYNTNMS